MEFLRQDLKALRQQHNLCRMDGNLPGLCFKNFSLNADDIAYVIFLKVRVGFLSNAVPRHVRLDIPL